MVSLPNYLSYGAPLARASRARISATNDHSANDITLIPLELIKCNRDSVRKAREAYLIERGNTLEPLGMNKKDEM